MAVNAQQIVTIALILIASVFVVPALCKGFDANGEKDDGKREYWKQGN